MPPLSELQLNTETSKRYIQSIESTEIDPDIEERAERGRLSDPHLDAIVGLPSDTYSAKSTEISAALSKLRSEGGLESHMRGRSSANCPYLGRLGITLAVSPEARSDQSGGETPAEVRARLRAKATITRNSEDTLQQSEVEDTVTAVAMASNHLNSSNNVDFEQVLTPELVPLIQVTERLTADTIQLLESTQAVPLDTNAEPRPSHENSRNILVQDDNNLFVESASYASTEVRTNSKSVQTTHKVMSQIPRADKTTGSAPIQTKIHQLKATHELIDRPLLQPSTEAIEINTAHQNVSFDTPSEVISTEYPEAVPKVDEIIELTDQKIIFAEVAELFLESTFIHQTPETESCEVDAVSTQVRDANLSMIEHQALPTLSVEQTIIVKNAIEAIEPLLRDLNVHQPELLTSLSSKTISKLIDRLMSVNAVFENNLDRVVVRAALYDALTELCSELSDPDDRELSKTLGTHEYKFYRTTHASVLGATKHTMRQWVELSRYVIAQARLPLSP